MLSPSLNEMVFARSALPAFTDVNGRPVGPEGLASAELRATYELRRCPFPGSRRHHALPMNVSAFKAMREGWPQMMAAVDLARTRYLERRRQDRMGLLDTLALSHAMVLTPPFLLLRAVDPIGDGMLPGFASSNAKAYADIVSVLTMMTQRAALQPGFEERIAETPDPVAIHNFAEASGQFIGKNGVCAGPAVFVQEAIASLIHGNATYRGRHDELAATVVGSDAFWHYTDACLSLKILVQMVQVIAISSALSLRGALDAVGPAEHERERALRERLDQLASAPPAALSHSQRAELVRRLAWAIHHVEGFDDRERVTTPDPAPTAHVREVLSRAAPDAREPWLAAVVDHLAAYVAEEQMWSREFDRIARRVVASLDRPFPDLARDAGALRQKLGPTLRGIVETLCNVRV